MCVVTGGLAPRTGKIIKNRWFCYKMIY